MNSNRLIKAQRHVGFQGFIISIEVYITKIFLDRDALEWINLSDKQQEKLIAAIATKFHGFSYDKKHIYIKKIYSVSEFENYLQSIENNNQDDYLTTNAIKKTIEEEKQNHSVLPNQYCLHFVTGDFDAKMSNSSEYISEKNPALTTIDTNTISHFPHINIEQMKDIDEADYIRIFTNDFSLKTIENIHQQSQTEAENRINHFKINVFKKMISFSKIKKGDVEPDNIKFLNQPLYIDSNNYHNNISLVEKRLGIKSDILFKLEEKFLLAKTLLDSKLHDIQIKHTQLIEKNLFQLHEKLKLTCSFESSDEEFKKAGEFITFQIAQLNTQYDQLKESFFIHSDYQKIVDFVEQQQKSLPSKFESIQYGNFIDISLFIKENLAIALYQAALEFRIELLKKLNNKDVLSKVKHAVDCFNNVFNNAELYKIASLTDLFQIIPAKDTSEIMIAPLLAVETFINKLLSISDDGLYQYGLATRIIIGRLAHLNSDLENILGFKVYNIQEKSLKPSYKTLCKPAGFKFHTNLIDDKQLLKSTKTIVNQIIKFDMYLDDLALIDMEQFISNEVKTNSKRIESFSMKALQNVEEYLKWIFVKQSFSQTIKLVTKKINVVTSLQYSLSKNCEIIKNHIKDGNTNDLDIAIKEKITQDVGAILAKLDELSHLVDDHYSSLNQIDRAFNILYWQLTNRFDHALAPGSIFEIPQNATEYDENEKRINKLQEEIKPSLLALEEIELQFKKLQQNVSHLDQLITSNRYLIDLRNNVVKISETNLNEIHDLSIKHLQIRAFEFYSEQIKKFDEILLEIQKYRLLDSQALSDFEVAIQNKIDLLTNDVNELINDLNIKSKKYTIKLLCHLIVNAILFCYQKRFQVNALIELLMNESFVGWQEDEIKAENLIKSFQLLVQNNTNTSKDICELCKIVSELNLEAVNNNSVCNLITQLISFNYLAGVCSYKIEPSDLEQLHINLHKSSYESPKSPKVIEYKTDKSFFKRHQWKILVCATAMSLLALGFLTFGILPTTLGIAALISAPIVEAFAGACIGVILDCCRPPLSKHKLHRKKAKKMNYKNDSSIRRSTNAFLSQKLEIERSPSAYIPKHESTSSLPKQDNLPDKIISHPERNINSISPPSKKDSEIQDNRHNVVSNFNPQNH